MRCKLRFVSLMLFLLYHPVSECFNNRKVRSGSSEHSGEDKNGSSRGIQSFKRNNTGESRKAD